MRWRVAPGNQYPATAEVSPQWGRGRLLGIVAAAALLAALLIAGFGYAIHYAVTAAGHDADISTRQGPAAGSTDPAEAQGEAARDAIAAAPMYEATASDAQPAEVAAAAAPAMDIPLGTGVPGPAMVMTGYPHTAEGAVAQLAQFDIAVLQAMDIPTAVEVYQAWALPGGVEADDWWLSVSVKAFLDSAQMGQVKDASAAVRVEPVAAMVKGTDGPDWTLVCVLSKVTAIYQSQARTAFAHCERMEWVGGRWMIAPGPPPAPAPATWAGTPAALEAGWKSWHTSHDTEGNDH